MAGQGQTGRQNQNLLPRWLATHQDDNHREYAIGSDHQGRYRNVAVFGRVLKCQLRAENVKKDAAQGGGVTLIRHAPKLKLMKEYGRSLRLDDEAEKKLLMAPLPAIGGNAAFNFSRTSSS